MLQNDRNDRGNLPGPSFIFPPLGPACQESDVCNAYAEQGGARHPAVEELVSGIPWDQGSSRAAEGNVENSSSRAVENWEF